MDNVDACWGVHWSVADSAADSMATRVVVTILPQAQGPLSTRPPNLADSIAHSTNPCYDDCRP